MSVIETHDLCKSIHGVYAVENLNLTVPEGAIYSFIGENGSGKSTAEKMITGLMNPKCSGIKLGSVERGVYTACNVCMRHRELA